MNNTWSDYDIKPVMKMEESPTAKFLRKVIPLRITFRDR